jgi:hypothetical protein
LASHGTAGLVFGKRIWIPLLVAVGAALGWQLLGLMPKAIEESVSRELLDKGVVVSSFPVERIGFRSSMIGQGAMVLGTTVLEWDSIRADYRARDLVAGRLDVVSFANPRLVFHLPDYAPAPRPPAAGPVSADSPAPSPAAPAGLPDAGSPLPAAAAVPGKTLSLWDHFQSMPFNSFMLPDGVMNFQLQEDELFVLAMDVRLDRQPYGAFGELSLKSGGTAGHVSVRAPADRKIVTFQGETVMPPGAIRDKVRHFLDSRESRHPGVLSSGPLRLDFVADFPAHGLPRGSGELSLAEISFGLPGLSGEFRFHNLLAGFVYKNRTFIMQGGVKASLPETDGFRSDSFGLRFSFDSPGGLVFESEAIPWQFGDYSGSAALRGSATPRMSGRVECAFSRIEGQSMEIEPFSVLLRGNPDRLSLESSPVGLGKQGILWLEDLTSQFDLASRSGTAGFRWYDRTGRDMGSVGMELAAPGDGGNKVGLSLSDRADAVFLSATGEFGPETRLDLAGKLSIEWLNAINRWGEFTRLEFSGPDPSLSLHLYGNAPLFRGNLALSCSDLAVESDRGVRLEGLETGLELEVNGLPRTRSPQLTRARLLRSGRLELRNLELEWEMPTFRDIRVHRLTASLGDGTVRTDPFPFDPLEPALDTLVHFEGIDAGQFLEWLDEERFQIEGSLSGTLQMGWKPGILVLGKGSLVMDDDAGGSLFTFSDPQFLRERFAAMEGVQPELRERFLETLLAEGIRIGSMDAVLEAGDEPGMLLLRISLSGESRGDQFELPIEKFVINNLISAEDLASLFGLLGGMRLEMRPIGASSD